MNTVVLLGAVAAVVATGALVAAVLRLGSPVAFLLAVFVATATEVVALSLLLSGPGWLARSHLLAGIGVMFAVAVLAWDRSGRPRPPLGKLDEGVSAVLGDRVIATLAVVVTVTQLYLLASALTVPQSVSDTLLYHLPRAALWKQERRVGYVRDAPDERINAAPPNAEIGITASMILSGGDRYASLVQLASLIAICLGVVGIARRLGFTTREAVFPALLYSTCTVVALQTPTALNDLALAAPLVACAYFGLGTTRAELGLAAVALGLALGTKLTAVLALPVLAVFLLVAQPRARWLSLASYGLLGLALGSVWYWVNLRATGTLDGGFSKAFPQIADRSPGAVVERFGRLLRDLLELSGAEGEGWLAAPWPGLAASVVALLVALAAVARGRRGAAGALVLVSFCAAVVYPTVATWADIAVRAARQLAAVGGGAEITADRVPAQLHESPLGSAFGIGFVVLLVSGAALVTRELAGRRRIVALVAIGSVPAFLVILVLALEYDPLRMRFLAFPAALASATFGVVLRVRPVAWVAVGLSTASLAVAAGYFVPRPAGLAVLPDNRSGELNARWYVQAVSGNGNVATFRFLAEEVPTDTTIALAVRRNTYTYQAWDAGLERRVVFVSSSGGIPREAEWLVIGPGVEIAERTPSSSWLPAHSSGGWQVLRRRG